MGGYGNAKASGRRGRMSQVVRCPRRAVTDQAFGKDSRNVVCGVTLAFSGGVAIFATGWGDPANSLHTSGQSWGMTLFGFTALLYVFGTLAEQWLATRAPVTPLVTPPATSHHKQLDIPHTPPSPTHIRKGQDREHEQQN